MVCHLVSDGTDILRDKLLIEVVLECIVKLSCLLADLSPFSLLRTGIRSKRYCVNCALGYGYNRKYCLSSYDNVFRYVPRKRYVRLYQLAKNEIKTKRKNRQSLGSVCFLNANAEEREYKGDSYARNKV